MPITRQERSNAMSTGMRVGERSEIWEFAPVLLGLDQESDAMRAERDTNRASRWSPTTVWSTKRSAFIGLDLNKIRFFKKDDRVSFVSSAMLRQHPMQRSWVGSKPFANPQQMEQMNRESCRANSSRSRTLSTSSMARVGWELEGSRAVTTRTERAFKERNEEPII